MSRPTWDEVWLAMAEFMGKRSRCLSGPGAVIVDAENRIIGSGYAGPPANFVGDDDDREHAEVDDCRRYCRRSRLPGDQRGIGYDDCVAVHAEINALMKTDPIRLPGSSVYVSSACCLACAKAIANSGAKRVIWSKTSADGYRDPDRVIQFLRWCGIEVVVVG